MSLRPVPARKVIKLLNKVGFQTIRQRGSHVILKHPDGRVTLNWRERKLPTSGRGVSEPLQLKCLAHTGSAEPNETIPKGTVGSDVVEMSETSNKAPNRNRRGRFE